jgi:hypothetical protein
MPINNALTPEGQNALGAAFGYYPQLRRNRTLQDPRLAAEMPLQFLRGRAAATLGLPSDVANLVRTPMPMEMYGDVDYGQQAQVPYGSQELLRTLPLPPQGAAQTAAANVGAVVPLTPMEALQAARAARQAAFAGGRALGPTAARMTEGYLQRQGLMPGVLPAEAPKFNANQLAQSVKPRAEVSPLGFYSAVEQQALNLPRKQGTGESFLNDLAKGQDVKKYEMETMGLDAFLRGRTNVTRQEVQDFIAGNRINVQERQLGGVITEDPIGIAKRKEIFDKYEPQMQAMMDEYSKFNKALDDQTMLARDKFADAHARLNTQGYMPTAQDYEAYNLADAELKRIRLLPRNMGAFQQKINNLKDIRDAEANAAYVVPEVPSTKYDKYQLPGGENYREILLTLPEARPNPLIEIQQKTKRMEAMRELQNEFANLGDMEKAVSFASKADDLQASIKQLEKMPVTRQTENYQSSHFDEPNILAHMRVNDRIDADGKKMLLIEEVQSDWHQAGRERGYDSTIKKPTLEEKQEWRRLDAIDPSNRTTEQYARLNELDYVIAGESKGVPDAPFKDTWHQLALKRALKEAVDKGYDRIGLTTGKQQIDRFSDQLRQNVDEINFNPIGTQNEISVNAKKNGQNTFSGTIKDGKFIDGSAVGKTVEEVLGKTMAKQIAEKKDGVIKGDDLTIGGEGMKKYYDEIYPAFLEKQGKKYGAKVGETKLTGTGSKDELAQKVYGIGETYKNLPSEQKRKIDQMFMEKGAPVRYLDITPEMRKAIKEGQPIASITNHLANAMA